MSENKRIAKNAVYLYFRMFLVMGVTLYTSRVVLKQLGVSDYGVYSVVGGFVALFGFLQGAMASATQRFLTYHLGRGEFDDLRDTFSATLTIHMGIALCLFILAESVGLWYINYKMIYPFSRTLAVNVVYQFSIMSAIIEIIQVPYNALIIAHERMKIFAFVSIAEVVLKLLVAVLLVFIAGDKLIIYAALIFVVILMIRIYYQFFCKKHYKESIYHFIWDRKLYKNLISFSGWSLFGSLAGLARTQGNNIILNLFFGTYINAAYGITSQIQNAILSFAQNFQMAVDPQIIKRFSKGSFYEMEELICQSAKFSFFMLLIISVPIYINIDYILKVWLTNVPNHTSNFVRFALLFILIDSLSFSLIKAIQASGKIKYYQIVVGTLICLNLPISYLFLKLGFQPEIVFIILVIITVMSLGVRMFFVKKILQLSPLFYLRTVLYPVTIVVSITFLIYYALKKYLLLNINATDFYSFLIQSIVSIVLILGVIVLLGMTKNDRIKILKFFK